MKAWREWIQNGIMFGTAAFAILAVIGFFSLIIYESKWAFWTMICGALIAGGFYKINTKLEELTRYQNYEAPPRVGIDDAGFPFVMWIDKYPTGDSKEDASNAFGWKLALYPTAAAVLLTTFFTGQRPSEAFPVGVFVGIIVFSVVWRLRPQYLREAIGLKPASPYIAARFAYAECFLKIMRKNDELFLEIGRASSEHSYDDSTYRHPLRAIVRWDDSSFSSFELRKYKDVFSHEGKINQIHDNYAITIGSIEGPVLIAHSGLEFAHIERLHRFLELQFTGKKRAELLENWRARKHPQDHPSLDKAEEIPSQL